MRTGHHAAIGTELHASTEGYNDRSQRERRRFLRTAALPLLGGALGPLQLARAALGPGGAALNAIGKGGLMVETTAGVRGNFEMLALGTLGNIDFYSRNNDTDKQWREMLGFGIGSRHRIDGAAQIMSSYGHVEAVTVEQGQIKTWWRDATWHSYAAPAITDAQGWPGFIQSTNGNVGNFELVVGTRSGGMAHYWRDNDSDGLPWKFYTKLDSGNVKGVSLIQSNFIGPGGKGNLEALAWVSDRVEHWTCVSGFWQYGGVVVASGVGGCPAFIQSNWGTKGNFEALVPMTSGGLQHCYRSNDVTGFPWSMGPLVGSAPYQAVGFIQGYDGGKGNFEVAALTNGRFDGFYRTDDAVWHANAVQSIHPISGNPAQLGQSDGVVDAMVTGINASLTSTGKVLLYGFPYNGSGGQTIQAALFDPASNTVSTLPNIRNQFCSGQTPLPNGQVLVVGGHIAETLKDVSLFEPATNQFTRVAVLTVARWYPTVAPMGNGAAIIISGAHNAGWSNNVENTWQTYSTGAGLGPLKPVPSPFSPYFPAGQTNIDLYPLVYQMPDGNLLIHARNTTRFLNPATGQWSTTILRTVSGNSRTYPFMGGALMLALRPAEGYKVRVLVTGGSADSANAVPGTNIPASTQAAADCELLDMSAAAPAWRQVASMNIARLMHDTVLLPDGTVFAIGGNRMGKADYGSGPTYRPELYDPAANTWTLLASTRVARGYHSCALLLPDGRVAIMGKDGDFQGESLAYAETRIETFSPPYLFKGVRPRITSAPSVIGFGQQFSVDCDASATVAKSVLVRCGSVTHQNNFSQRLVELVMSRASATSLTLTAPPHGNVAPPGHYMLFVLGTNGVPSVSVMVRLGSTQLSAAEAIDMNEQSEPVRAVSLERAGEAPFCASPTSDSAITVL